jgi:hypothetical protein
MFFLVRVYRIEYVDTFREAQKTKENNTCLILEFNHNQAC